MAPKQCGFVPKSIFNAKKKKISLSFIVSRTLTCVRMLVYAYACIKHVYVELEHACTYVCMHMHALVFPLSLFFKNSLCYS